MSTHSICFCGEVRKIVTLKTPRKPASENVVCLCRLLNILANFSNLFLHTGKQCGPRSDCSCRSSLIWVHTVCRSSLIWVHTVCLYAKIGLKSLQEYSADINRKKHLIKSYDTVWMLMALFFIQKILIFFISP